MQIRKAISPFQGRLPCSTCFCGLPYWLFFAGSLDEPEVEPLPDWSLLDELEPLEDEDAGGVAALLELDGGVALLLLELDGLDGVLIEPDAEPLLEGDDGVVAVEPVEPAPERLDDAPVVPVPLEPRSQPASAAPNAIDTTTAKVESFMLPP